MENNTNLKEQDFLSGKLYKYNTVNGNKVPNVFGWTPIFKIFSFVAGYCWYC